MPKQCDEIDYRLVGDDMQAVIITLDPQEQVIAEAGTMLYMTPGVEMQTTMSTDKNKGFFGNLMKGIGRMVTGESFFVTTFTNNGRQRRDVAFAAPYAGKITPLDMSKHANEVICQKDSFLCAARGTEVSIHFQKKIGTGLFGGEGFILQKLKGDGLAFVHAGGTVIEMALPPGETLRVDTGCIVAMETTVDYDIQFIGGFKNALFGGEGLFTANLTGPGTVWLQTLPFSRLADRIIAASSAGGGGNKEGGSILGGFLQGDNE